MLPLRRWNISPHSGADFTYWFPPKDCSMERGRKRVTLPWRSLTNTTSVRWSSLTGCAIYGNILYYFCILYVSWKPFKYLKFIFRNKTCKNKSKQSTKTTQRGNYFFVALHVSKGRAKQRESHLGQGQKMFSRPIKIVTWGNSI